MHLHVRRPISQPQGITHIFAVASIFMIVIGVLAYMLCTVLGGMSFVQWYLATAAISALIYSYTRYFHPETFIG